MEVREDVPALVDDDAGAEAGGAELSGRLAGTAPSEELIEEVLEERIVGAGGPGPPGGRRARATWTVPTCTTAGRTRPATVTNASCRASAVDRGDGGAAAGRDTAAVHRPRAQKPAPATATSATTRSGRAVLGVMEGRIGTPNATCQSLTADGS